MTRSSFDAVRSFLNGTGTDDCGRSHAAILRCDDDWLERTHDFIQWLFPIDTRSGANPGAPVVTPAQAAQLAQDPVVLENLRAALARMGAFYGLECRGAAVQAGRDPARIARWAAQSTHNDLRITRMLRASMLFGLSAEAAQWQRAAVDALHRFRGGDPVVEHHWRSAIRAVD